MTNTISGKPGPIEVWLSQDNMQVACRIAHQDETITQLDVSSLSIRGAQREMTGYLISQGYKPAGRWTTEAAGSDGPAESSRQFKPE